MSKHRTRWSAEEKDTLRSLTREGHTYARIAEMLGRSEHAINIMAYHLDLKHPRVKVWTAAELATAIRLYRAGKVTSDNGSMSGGNYERTPKGPPYTDEAKQWQGWGTALKPALEPITVARKPLVGTVAENVLQHGTGAINVDEGRVGVDGATKRSSQAEYPRNEDGTEDRSGCWARTGHAIKSVPMGRWPANFIHDGSEEATDLLKDSARFFYCAKASKADRDAGLDGSHSKQMDESRKQGNPGGDNPRNRGVQERTNFHPTVKPTDLMRYLCRLVTPPNGIVLDPFNGSGSTGCAAVLEGFQYIGIEREAEYIAISEKRIQARSKQVQEQPKQIQPIDVGLHPVFTG